MRKHQTSVEALDLLHRGTLALAEVERSGVRVDRAYLDKTIAGIDETVRELEAELKRDGEVWPVWVKAYGDKAKLSSPAQLSHVLFRKMGFVPKAYTDGSTEENRIGKTSAEAIEHLGPAFIPKYIRMKKLEKAKTTYLGGIRRELVQHADGNWYVHPSYSLNRATTFRSATSDPNWQNNPVRNPEQAAIVRPCYVARPGNHFVEVDFGQIEVRVAACYTKDPRLAHDVVDGDMHMDEACEILFLEPWQVGKDVRHVAKNRFVFPEFYGSRSYQCAPNIWDALVRQDLRVRERDGSPGMTVVKHLKSKGIKGLGECDPNVTPARGTFAAHLAKIEDRFWNERYPVYTRWKEDTYRKYLREGGMVTKTGFAMNGIFSRNDVLNWRIQCDGFQCCLWSVIELVRWFRKYKMKSRVIGEIHDSTQFDVPPDELQDVLDVAEQVMTKDLPAAWPWIEVPITVEHEVSPVGKSWHDKAEWVRGASGEWGPKKKGK